MRILSIVFLLFIAGNTKIFAQIKRSSFPVDVYLDTDSIVVPPAYFMVGNRYHFHTKEMIDSLYFCSSYQFNIEKESENTFVISKQPKPSEEYEFVTEIEVAAVCHSGKIIAFQIPVKLFPTVKVDFFTKDYTPIDLVADSIYAVHSFSCKAQWDYPSYITSPYFRYRGVFEVDVTLNDQRVMGTTGWYDAGDHTQSIDLSPLGIDTLVEVSIREKSLKTLIYDGFPSAFRNNKIELSPNMPKKVLMVVQE